MIILKYWIKPKVYNELRLLSLYFIGRKNNEKIKRKILKDHSNPLDAPGESHVKFD